MSDLRAGPWTLPIGRVANIYLKAQTTAIATTTLVTPVKGLYRVSVALAITTGTDGQSQITANILSKGDNAVVVTQSLATLLPGIFPFPIAQDAFVCECDGVAPIQYSTTLVTQGDSPTYTLRIVAEQLSILT
jgi:hypothetical protein